MQRKLITFYLEFFKAQAIREVNGVRPVPAAIKIKFNRLSRALQLKLPTGLLIST